MTDLTEYPGMDGPLVDRIAWARYTGVMSLFAKKALEDAEAALRAAVEQRQPPTREQITDAVKHAVLDASFLSERDANAVWRRVHLALDAMLTKEADRG